MKALIALLLATTAASAADMNVYTKAPPPVAPMTLPAWAGGYIGAQVGYGVELSNANVFTGGTTFDLASMPRGPILGGQIGYDWSIASNIVFGIRVDADYANMNATGTLGPFVTVNNSTNYLLDAVGRLGYSGFGNHVLLYVDGGFAAGGRKPNIAALGMPTVAASDTSTGWVLGGGIETKLTQTISTFGEIDYYDLGNQSLSATIAGTSLVTSSTPFKFGVAKFGLNLHL